MTALIAQWIEHLPSKQLVVSSSLTRGTGSRVDNPVRWYRHEETSQTIPSIQDR